MKLKARIFLKLKSGHTPMDNIQIIPCTRDNSILSIVKT
ncbi:hypothetical protein HCH_04125 [Hahella chejuensis KCTC 2396]|uniref:Uncharacterized protein n=1 Tax=Hahella chejuensis (strain KCTC 2396) TaxID=349521 RepID=Q2SET9_HAHCH|nr:hypothetical protein HCH_04125 [Hahella chejuensis KCTC 2396]